jgi:hypothetical protein
MSIPTLLAAISNELQTLLPSPTKASFSPFKRPNLSQIVKISAKAWQGWL